MAQLRICHCRHRMSWFDWGSCRWVCGKSRQLCSPGVFISLLIFRGALLSLMNRSTNITAISSLWKMTYFPDQKQLYAISSCTYAFHYLRNNKLSLESLLISLFLLVHSCLILSFLFFFWINLLAARRLSQLQPVAGHGKCGLGPCKDGTSAWGVVPGARGWSKWMVGCIEHAHAMCR